MKKKHTLQNNIVLYQAKNGAIELRGDAEKETIWASLQQIADLFGVDKSGASRHIRNIFASGELQQNAVVAKIATTATDGKTYQVDYYNLDLILSVGYRVNSKHATQFRQWATTILRDHITKGYTINKSEIASHYDAFMKSVADIQALLPEHVVLDSHAVLELVKAFSTTWMSLDAYDKDALVARGTSKRTIKLSSDELLQAVHMLKTQLVKKKEATEIFAQERNAGNVEGIIGNVLQSFGGQSMYPSVEEKAAHLLYFMVKNHPFVDGNKRSGAFAFLWFLKKAKVRGVQHINPAALTAITLLIAESKPKEKERMAALVVTLLTGKN